MELRAMLHLLLASRLYKRSQGGARSLPVILDDFGKAWYVSRKNAVISSNNIQAIIRRGTGQLDPYVFILATNKRMLYICGTFNRNLSTFI